MRIVPPPLAPDASIVVPSATWTFLASTLTCRRSRRCRCPTRRSCRRHSTVPSPASRMIFAVLRRHAGRLDHAGVVDDVVDDVARRARRHQHMSAIGGDRAAVGHQRGLRAAVGFFGVCLTGVDDGEAQQIVAGEIDAERARAGQHDVAHIGLDQALIVDAGAREDGRAAARGLDRALVDDRSVGIGRGDAEIVVARNEIGIAHVGGRGDQPADIDLAALAEQHAVGVDQPDFPVANRLPSITDGERAQHAVERDGGGIGLQEAARSILTRSRSCSS